MFIGINYSIDNFMLEKMLVLSKRNKNLTMLFKLKMLRNNILYHRDNLLK
jgi:hypothetical protein